jgi:hypothetical protein
VDPLTGTVVITSTNADQPGTVQAPFHPYLAISSDQGTSFSLQELDSAPFLAGSAITQPMPSPAFANDGLFMAIYPSYDPVQSILPRIVEVNKSAVSSFYNYQIAFQGLGFGTQNDTLKRGAHLALDPGNSTRASYTFLTDVFGDTDIAYFEKSNGVWSAPARINQDAQGNGIIQDLVWSDYDNDGDLAVCWRDRRNGLPGTYQSPSQIFCRIQSNQTWGTEFLISPLVNHDSILLDNGNDFLNVQFTNNQLYTIWGDVRQGTLKIYLNHFDQLSNSSSTSSIPTFDPVFPNPSKGMFNIPPDLVGLPFILHAMEGHTLKKGTLLNDLDLSEYGAGTYFLKVGQYTFPLVKN